MRGWRDKWTPGIASECPYPYLRRLRGPAGIIAGNSQYLSADLYKMRLRFGPSVHPKTSFAFLVHCIRRVYVKLNDPITLEG